MSLITMVRSAKHGRLRKLVYVLVATMAIIGVIPQIGNASTIPADEASQLAAMRQDNLAKIRVTLERQEVAAKLADYGLTPAEVSARLDQVSDQQASEIAAQIDQMNAGGDAVGLLISIALLVILILVILWLLGRKDADLKMHKLTQLPPSAEPSTN
jgi:hypothetical protein